AILFLLILFFTGFVGMRQQKSAMENLYGSRFSNYQAAAGTASGIATVNGSIYRVLAWASSRKASDEMQKGVTEEKQRLQKAFADIQTLAKSAANNDVERAIWNKVQEQMAEYTKIADGALGMALIDASF